MDMRHVICEYAAAILMATALLAPSPAMAGKANWLGAAPQILGFQKAVIGQRLLPMHRPYAGPNSLPGNGVGAVSQSYLVSTGSQINSRLQAYLDLPLQIGNAINNGSGLAG
jgi:hypothetical protein